MTTLTKESAIQAGGNVWVKDSMERVYLNVASINSLLVDAGYGNQTFENPSKKVKQAKTFLDVNSGELKSDVGAIRSVLNATGFECSK